MTTSTNTFSAKKLAHTSTEGVQVPTDDFGQEVTMTLYPEENIHFPFLAPSSTRTSIIEKHPDVYEQTESAGEYEIAQEEQLDKGSSPVSIFRKIQYSIILFHVNIRRFPKTVNFLCIPTH